MTTAAGSWIPQYLCEEREGGRRKKGRRWTRRRKTRKRKGKERKRRVEVQLKTVVSYLTQPIHW